MIEILETCGIGFGEMVGCDGFKMRGSSCFLAYAEVKWNVGKFYSEDLVLYLRY